MADKGGFDGTLPGDLGADVAKEAKTPPEAAKPRDEPFGPRRGGQERGRAEREMGTLAELNEINGLLREKFQQRKAERLQSFTEKNREKKRGD